MNKVILIGRLTRDPDLRYPSSNVPVANFTMAVNRPFLNQQGEREADFINVIVWRKQAENVKKYIAKGSQVAVEGRIQTRNYDGPDGNKRYVTEVIAESVTFLESKNQSQSRVSSAPAGSDAPSEVTPFDFANNEGDVPTTDLSDDDYANFNANIDLTEDVPW